MAMPLSRFCSQAARRTQPRCRNFVVTPFPDATPRSGSSLERSVQARTRSPQYRPFSMSQPRDLEHDDRQDQSMASGAEAEFPESSQATELPKQSHLNSTAYAELEQHREMRRMARLAAWDMPQLSAFSKKFEKPDRHEVPLRWRYTTYFGEPHPADRKVVVEFSIRHLQLTPAQALKLKKLVGARYDPIHDRIKMSCESFETQAQNKRYLGDTIAKLLAEVRDPTADSFADVPLDLRHHKLKRRPEFPKEWLLTRPRFNKLLAKRESEENLDSMRIAEGARVSGIEEIENAVRDRVQRGSVPEMEELLIPATKGPGAKNKRR